MRATLYYTVLRFGLFIAAFGILYVAGARSILLLGGAILISGIASYFVLTPQRNAMSNSISKRFTGLRDRLDAGARTEDDD